MHGRCVAVNPRSRKKSSTIIEPNLLLAAYASGYFPMAESSEGEIHWLSPDPRAIIPLDTFTIPRSLRQILKKRLFEIRLNTSFEEVMRTCADRTDTWISEDIIQSYLRLHKLRFAHSIETWKEGSLAGGLYGVALGAAFFGESMFSRVRDASKVALVHLVERLRVRKFELLDTQFITPHLAHFGTVEIPRDEYLALLATAIRKERRFLD
ncbi:MAG: leucyl/phenylalanyl-tRNA--protein transferase [Ignavibacteriae bacterium]|nr:leucyl/phenylalanyl-tRNA--protein transferase [Ignavibacteria bacterium]MBI3364944.1 leucyl/phenylalanyl-tRNA--protein transferase [Ignavibacteriota bacterium]